MLLHNLKIAVRNLLKYKLQTTISVLSIAIGIVVLAMVHGYAQIHMRAPEISEMDYYDRSGFVFFDSLHKELDYTKHTIPPGEEVLNALKSGGELKSVEMGPTYVGNYYQSDGTFTLGDTLVRKYKVDICLTEKSYAHYAGYKSAITGKQIAVLRPKEVILPKMMAEKIFGDINPIGAYLEFNIGGDKYSLTVADVYDYVSNDDNSRMLYSLDDDTFRQMFKKGREYIHVLYVVLKPGSKPKDLEQEINIRVGHLGLQCKVMMNKEYQSEELQELTKAKAIIYTLGSLILLAASIGFLRMQIQLFYMRKRELSLRIVNGAKRPELFVLLMTEVLLVLLASTIVALLIGGQLENLANTLFQNNGGRMVFADRVLPYSAAIGGMVLLICGITVWFTLERICKNAQGLASNMRGARNHAFRNAMLWLQVTVGMLFVSATFVMTLLCHRSLNKFAMPDDDTPYRESIMIVGAYAYNGRQLLEEISALPDVAQIIPCNSVISSYKEVDAVGNGSGYFSTTYETNDTTLFKFYDMPITWLKPEFKDEKCIIVSKEKYAELDSAGVIQNGILTFTFGGLLINMQLYDSYGKMSMPIAGIFDAVPYKKKRKGIDYIMINPLMKETLDYIIVPKKNRYAALWNAVNNTIARVEPSVVNKIAFNLYDLISPDIEILKNFRKAGWILGGVALLICIMGIYSTVALDTRARRKEVAIRKINGAKPKDIALLFARLYIIIIALAVTALIPVALMFQRRLDNEAVYDPVCDLSVAPLAIAGCFVVSIVIAIIVGWQVRGIMKINPVEMIVKE